MRECNKDYKLPVPERKFRVGLLKDPYCQKCVEAEIADLEHYFCCCLKIEDIWSWLRGKLNSYNSEIRNISNWELLNLFLPSSLYEKEIVWLLSNYIWFVWDRTHARELKANLRNFFGYLTFKYRDYVALSGSKLCSFENFE